MTFLKNLKTSLIVVFVALLVFVPKSFAAVAVQKNNNPSLTPTTTNNLPNTNGSTETSTSGNGPQATVKPKSARTTKSS